MERENAAARAMGSVETGLAGWSAPHTWPGTGVRPRARARCQCRHLSHRDGPQPALCRLHPRHARAVTDAHGRAVDLALRPDGKSQVGFSKPSGSTPSLFRHSTRRKWRRLMGGGATTIFQRWMLLELFSRFTIKRSKCMRSRTSTAIWISGGYDSARSRRKKADSREEIGL
jgi:hypothetical protein